MARKAAAGDGAGDDPGRAPAKASAKASGKAAGKTAGKAPAKARSKRGAGASKAPPQDLGRRWTMLALAVIVGVALVRLVVNWLDWVPVHFDEGQYWGYGREMAFGHFSKPPLVGWVLYLSTEILGHHLFALRLPSVLAHAGIAWLLFLTGRRLFDAPTGFWAAVAYTAAPGVTASAMIASTDPIMMLCWALALWAHVRAAEEGDARWFALMGMAIGLGCLAKYTMIAFAGGAVAYGWFSARERDWKGFGLAALLGLVVFAPNLFWNAANGFATFGHVAEDAAAGQGAAFRPDKFAEFAGSQFGVIGPVILAGIFLALWRWRRWRGDWRMRLLAWQTFPLLLGMLALALTTRAHPNWAAPAYVAGSLMAAHWILGLGWRRALAVQATVGAVAAVLLYAAAGLYGERAADLPRWADPFKKMRLAEPFCEPALAMMGEAGADAFLTDDRRRMAECMFLGSLPPGEFAVWDPDGVPENHYELVAGLRPGDDRRFLLALLGSGRGEAFAGYFEEAELLDEGAFATHADRSFGYELWLVEGFLGYGE